MIKLDPNHDPRMIRSIDCGRLVVAEEVRASLADEELKKFLDRHLNLDFGEKTGDEELYNFFAITMKMGIARSCYQTEGGQTLHIHTDLAKEETKIFLSESPIGRE